MISLTKTFGRQPEKWYVAVALPNVSAGRMELESTGFSVKVAGHLTPINANQTIDESITPNFGRMPLTRNPNASAYKLGRHDDTPIDWSLYSSSLLTRGLPMNPTSRQNNPLSSVCILCEPSRKRSPDNRSRVSDVPQSSVFLWLLWQMQSVQGQHGGRYIHLSQAAAEVAAVLGIIVKTRVGGWVGNAENQYGQRLSRPIRGRLFTRLLVRWTSILFILQVSRQQNAVLFMIESRSAIAEDLLTPTLGAFENAGMG